MPNFDEMAKAARAKSDGLVDAAAQAEREKQEIDNQRIATAEAFLRENVLPIVERAATAFAANGIDVKFDLAKSWRFSSRGADMLEIRALSFQCQAKAEGDAQEPRIQGVQYIFEHDGTDLSWKTYMDNSSGVRFSGGTVDEFVTTVIGRALDAYFEKLRETQKRRS